VFLLGLLVSFEVLASVLLSEEQPANASMNVIDKINAISFFTLKASFIKSLFIVLFYRQFRLCITKAAGKAHTPKVVRILRLPCVKGAVA